MTLQYSSRSILTNKLVQPVCLIILFVGVGHVLHAAQNRKERTMRAVRVREKIVIDGELNEPAWLLAEPATDFIQRLPYTGEPATEKTEVRLIYDDENLYVGAFCFDSAGGRGIVVKDIKRDFNTLQSDGFQIVLDTFHDHRNSYLFGTNPKGGTWDMMIGGDGAAGNSAWNGIWYLKTKITPKGWQVEMAIPFKTLRFAENQVWGVNFERRVRRKHEDSYWSPLPAAFRLGRVSLAGDLEGIEGAKQGRNLYIKPYILTPVQRKEGEDLAFKPTAGFDLKYAVGSQSTLDLTAHTDFSQVEADEEKINLTRFDLFFPEKREFFLENAGLFGFGRSRTGGYRQDMMPFFSRRIGISPDRKLVPILGGARMTGRMGKYTMGLLSMETDTTDTAPSANYSVARVRRDILKKSDFGAIFVNKQESGGGYNRTYGVDANFRVLKYLELSSFLLKSDSPDLKGKDTAANFEAAWKDDLFDVEARFFSVGRNFNPEAGFLARKDMLESSAIFALTPRPKKHIPWIRQMGPTLSVDYFTDHDWAPQSKLLQGSFDAVFQNGGTLSIGQRSDSERLIKPFKIRPSQTIPVGDYTWDEFFASFVSDRSRLFSCDLGLTRGRFWNGDRNSYRVGFDTQPGYHFTAGATWTYNDVSLPSGAFHTSVLATRIRYSFTTRMFLNALIQYNSDTKEVSSNIRFNLIYRPLSDIYLVYNERRSSLGDVIERAFIVKVTYVLAF
jgi:hypothetical protein